MNKPLFALGFLISAVGLVWWFATGANTGWTKTSVQRMEKEPITEIENPVWDKKFVPGVEFLVGTEAVSFGLIALALFRRRKPANP